MIKNDRVLVLQSQQYNHDMRNHFDILALSKIDRLKHYGLHFAKYAGRIARDSNLHELQKTLTDSILVSLSAANTLHQDLSKVEIFYKDVDYYWILTSYTDAAGRFADACEKIDHLEKFLSIAHDANRDLMQVALIIAHARQYDAEKLVQDRRKQLAERQFFIKEF